MKSIEVYYDFNKKSRMTNENFYKWLKAIDMQMRKKSWRNALITNNDSLQPEKGWEKLQDITIIFLQSDSTLKLGYLEVFKNT